ncbi:DUF4333 domain-containing protein [Nocardioides sp.]|uniref:DUF4333 domain-containing protein n=1 Tax=Nocardioides sp. TaxID=35761 RepID=UPI002BFF7224|nr:DUF4333 domain-containing protein [Nocardioides sp.]HXH80145.1 DUF4333 domain-containing protein [Nocardioides sp.]
MQRLSIAPISIVLSVFALSACGAGVVAEKDVEKGVSEQLTESVGQAPDDIDCPGDLEAEVGTTMRCTLTAGPDELGLTVTVTEVDGSDINDEVEVDQE